MDDRVGPNYEAKRSKPLREVGQQEPEIQMISPLRISFERMPVRASSPALNRDSDHDPRPSPGVGAPPESHQAGASDFEGLTVQEGIDLMCELCRTGASILKGSVCRKLRFTTANKPKTPRNNPRRNKPRRRRNDQVPGTGSISSTARTERTLGHLAMTFRHCQQTGPIETSAQLKKICR